MRDITPDMVVGLWDAMSDHYGSTIADKEDSDIMQLAGRALGIMGILDPVRFMEVYTTTIGDTIYTPFEIGVPGNGYSLIGQISICVHEHQHVIQWKRKKLRFMLEYLTDSALRARYEVEAMQCNMEIQWWYNRTLPDIPRSALKLKDYNCTPEDIAVAARSFKMISKVVGRGGVSTEASTVALSYLSSCV